MSGTRYFCSSGVEGAAGEPGVQPANFLGLGGGTLRKVPLRFPWKYEDHLNHLDKSPQWHMSRFGLGSPSLTHGSHRHPGGDEPASWVGGSFKMSTFVFFHFGVYHRIRWWKSNKKHRNPPPQKELDNLTIFFGGFQRIWRPPKTHIQRWNPSQRCCIFQGRENRVERNHTAETLDPPQNTY